MFSSFCSTIQKRQKRKQFLGLLKHLKIFYYTAERALIKTEGLVLLILERVGARPNLIIIKTSLRAVSNCSSWCWTMFLSLPTSLPGHRGVGMSPEHLHTDPKLLLCWWPSHSMGGNALLQVRDGVCSCNPELQLKGY